MLPTALGSKMLAGFTPEFMGRSDGYLGLKEKYGLNIRTVVISDAVMYKAAYQKKLDVISGYSTDGRLKAFDLVVLRDDKTIFPPYYAAPVVRRDLLVRFPEVEQALNLLAGQINDSIMTELNYRTDHLKQSPAFVAQTFLTEKHLYKKPRNGNKGLVRMGSKIFGEQYILLQLFCLVILGFCVLGVVWFSGVGGTKICFDALTNNQIDLYPEYTGTGLLVLLKPTPQQVQSIINNKQKVYGFVKSEFRKKYDLEWLQPIGFNNAYALMMRKSQASSLHIQTISDLKTYIDNNK
jgi:osmoprotectant transport system permease protein